MIDSLRIFTLMALHQIFKHMGPRRLNIFIFAFGSIYEILLSPFRNDSYKSKNLGEALSKTLQKAGPIYIKFGQTLSTRPDIIGEQIVESFRELQDKLPSFSPVIAKEILENQFHKKIEDVFDSFEEMPVAAASISQVHKAILKNGRIVAVKILRPNIQKLYSQNIKLLHFWIKFSTYLSPTAKRLKFLEIITHFKNIMKQELDLTIEAANSSEIRDNSQKDNIVKIPSIYWQYTTSQVLTSEWVNSISIYDIESIKKAGLDTVIISQKLATIFFNQAYRDGCFHADLHPGNVMVTKEGEIVLVDFGIVGRLPEKDRLAVTEILHGFLDKDYNRIAKIHKNIGYIGPDVDTTLFALSCRALGERIVGAKLKDVSVASILSELFKITRDYGMEVQPQLLLLQKTTIVLEGIGSLLNPDINMWKLAEPWIKKWAAKNISPEAKILRIIKAELDRLWEKF